MATTGITFTLEIAAAVTVGALCEMAADLKGQEASANSVTVVGAFTDYDPDALTATVAGPGSIVDLISDGSGAIAYGDKLRACANGEVKTANPADGATARQCVGIALDSAAASAGLTVPVLLLCAPYIGA